jgi:uncharacterized repeat protein (TIGR03847 family)
LRAAELMSEELQDFGRADLFDAESVGEPGSRRFRLFARSRNHTAGLWLEREQLEQLSIAIDRLLARLSGGEVLRPEAMAQVAAPPTAPDDFPAHPDLEFQVSSMQLGYDPDHDLILLRAAPLELIEREGELLVNEDSEPLFSVLITRAHATRLSAHLLSILASGRPRCPFCNRPMESPHICEKQNGYHPASLN